ncbi:MAG TPA: hypothetical protein PKY38_04775 [Opitutaceae bacterium]|nr:hypothetical protein [Opitutaceae bacterium]
MPAESAPDRAAWMSGHWGLMVHWIPPGPARENGPYIEDFDRAVSAFKVERFLQQFADTGADWLIFTIGQNTGFYASPNSVLDRLAGPGHCSQRDLVLEIAQGLHRLGKRFIPYLPAEIKAPTQLHVAFAWNPADQNEFERHYTAFIREYSLRLGRLHHGWWYDGCYNWKAFRQALRHWDWWGDASRAGNPDAALAFNDGSYCCGLEKPVTPLQDYLSGEIWQLHGDRIVCGNPDEGPVTYVLPTERFVTGTRCQWHGLLPIDCPWGYNHPPTGPMPGPKYSDADLFSFVRQCLAVGGGVTLNVGIYQEGHLPEATLRQLDRMRQSLRL